MKNANSECSESIQKMTIICIYAGVYIYYIHPHIWVLYTRSIYERELQKSGLDTFLRFLERDLILFYKSGATTEVIKALNNLIKFLSYKDDSGSRVENYLEWTGLENILSFVSLEKNPFEISV